MLDTRMDLNYDKLDRDVAHGRQLDMRIDKKSMIKYFAHANHAHGQHVCAWIMGTYVHVRA